LKSVFKRLLSALVTLVYYEPLSNFAFKFNVRRYSKVCWLLSAAAGDSKHPAPILALREKCERAALNGMAGRVFLATSSNAL